MTMADPALILTHAQQVDLLRFTVETAVARLWSSLTGYNEPDVAVWLRQVTPLVRGAQTRAAAVTEAYIARSLQDRIRGVPNTAVLDRARGEPFEDTYRRPFTATWSALSQGASYEEAVTKGGTAAVGAAAADVQRAVVASTSEALQKRPFVQAYRRVLAGPSTCRRCYLAAGLTYKKRDLMPVHAHCDCTVEPIPDREYVRGRPGVAARDVGSRIDRNGEPVAKPTLKQEADRKHQSTKEGRVRRRVETELADNGDGADG